MSYDWIEESHNVVDIIHGVIPYNGLEAKIKENRVFARLQRVLQSSLVYMTYPSNKVHRYEHSLGVMHLSGIYFYNAITNSDKPSLEKFFKEIYDKVEDYINTDGSRYGSKVLGDLKKKKIRPVFEDITNFRKCTDNALYRNNTPAVLSKNQLFLYYVTYEAIRLVGLLHDIGHLPYSHVSEHALRRLEQIINNKKKRNKEEERFLSIMKIYSGKSDIHEIIGKKLADKIFSNILEDINQTEKGSFYLRVFLGTTFYIAHEILNSNNTVKETSIFGDLHEIVDGVFDSDRMDYTCRDLYCAGVSKEFPRFERIFNTVKILYRKSDYSGGDDSTDAARDLSISTRSICHFACNSKAIGQMELLLQRRMEDFCNMNFHHSVHKHELIMELTIVELAKESLKNSSKQSRRKQDPNVMSFDISSMWNAMEHISSSEDVEILFSQLDDEWLNNVVKQYYFTKFGDTYYEECSNFDNIMWNMADELISGRKHYCTLFKRRGGFARFDNDFVHSAEELHLSIESEVGNTYFSKAFHQYGKWIPTDTFYKTVRDKIRKWGQTEEARDEYMISDCLIDSNGISIGTKANQRPKVYLVSSIKNSSDQSEFEEMSNIYKNLELQKELFPPFHIFYLPVYKFRDDIDKEKLQKKIADIMVSTFMELREIIMG